MQSCADEGVQHQLPGYWRNYPRGNASLSRGLSILARTRGA